MILNVLDAMLLLPRRQQIPWMVLGPPSKVAWVSIFRMLLDAGGRTSKCDSRVF